jgi:hypothetical protein
MKPPPMASAFCAGIFLAAVGVAGSGGAGADSGVGDAHTYHADGRVVRNQPQLAPEELTLSSRGLSAMAFRLLELGQDAQAARAFAAAARLSRDARHGCPAAFAASDGAWTASHGSARANDCGARRRGENFFAGAASIEDAVQRYAAFHRAEMRAGLSARGRYVLYRPSFHGEGWGNRMMALVAATALGIGTGRAVLLDWPSDWALDEFVEAPWGWARWDRAAADALPRAAVTDPPPPLVLSGHAASLTPY